jgi:multisubunit Na+/H+ antiporter MnhC subunit
VTAHAASSVPAEEPEDRAKPNPSGRLLLRMPRTLHAELAQAAEREGTSLNQYITAALATKVGAGPDEHRSAPNQTHSRVIAAALVANAVVIGLAAVAAIAVLVVALLG